jgi:ABC-2 type transport system ATP-binding protein
LNNILEVCGLHKHYETFSLQEVSFVIPQGYIMGFIGPNGAGKTTTIKAILNLIHYPAGSIRLLGQINPDPAFAANERLGVVMDSPFYVDEWTIYEVGKALAPFYTRWNQQKFADYLGVFGIAGAKRLKDLSRGMKVKLQIAVALSHEAELLILDEPTSGLDPVAREEICDLLREFVRDETRGVLFSTHITSDLEKIADYITFMQQGRVVYTGLKDALLEKYIRVSGNITELLPEQKPLIIGYWEHGDGFAGMAEVMQLQALPPSLLTEPINLEEIIIFMDQEAKI